MLDCSLRMSWHGLRCGASKNPGRGISPKPWREDCLTRSQNQEDGRRTMDEGLFIAIRPACLAMALPPATGASAPQAFR